SRKFGKSGNELNLNFDILNYKMQIHQVLDNKIYNILDTLMNNYTTLTSNLPSNINIQSIKLDYNHFLNNGGKIEVGTKISGIKAKNIADFSDVVNGQLVPNYIFSNNFNYNENINAAYVNHSREFSKFSYQIELRVENTIIDGFQFGNPFSKIQLLREIIQIYFQHYFFNII
ncbi:MAG: outer membrane beta-barrel protein, partial [Saprospiraceae bacterium]|nr:outer membrane beta-barrel protein [Saprospiraceae bacterium]